MEPLTPKVNVHEGPEAKIQKAIVKYLRYREWFVKETHGNAYQAGFPDLYATHIRWGPRWIEVKRIDCFSFTLAQIRDYPRMISNGSPIWIMHEDTDRNYELLFKPCNFTEWFVCYQAGKRSLLDFRAGR